MLTPILGALRPAFNSTIKQVRYLRPYLKIGKERYQITLDCRQFSKEGICIKASPECLIVVGKQEKTTPQGYIKRQFIRKFKFPGGVIPQKIESALSQEGILTISAPKSSCDVSEPCKAMYIPITIRRCPDVCKEKEKRKQNEREKAKKAVTQSSGKTLDIAPDSFIHTLFRKKINPQSAKL